MKGKEKKRIDSEESKDIENSKTKDESNTSERNLLDSKRFQKEKKKRMNFDWRDSDNFNTTEKNKKIEPDGSDNAFGASHLYVR